MIDRSSPLAFMSSVAPCVLAFARGRGSYAARARGARLDKGPTARGRRTPAPRGPSTGTGTQRLFPPRRLLLTLPAQVLGMNGTALAADQSQSGAGVPARRRARGAPLTATLLGEEVRTDNAAEMQRRVLDRLFDHYTEQQRLPKGLQCELARRHLE